VEYPTKWSIKVDQPDTIKTRSAGTQNLIEIRESRLTKGTFINDTAKNLNRAPDSIKNAKLLSIAKRK
jgi:hypothetical protein